MEFFTHVTVLAGLAVMGIQQLLKLKAVPLTFANKYPVPTVVVLSVGAALVTVWANMAKAPVGWTNWVQFAATIVVVAAVTYNMTLKNWAELRQMEG